MFSLFASNFSLSLSSTESSIFNPEIPPHALHFHVPLFLFPQDDTLLPPCGFVHTFFPLNLTASGNEVKMRSFAWTLTQSDRCPYKRKYEHTKRDKRAARTQGRPWDHRERRWHLQAKDTSLRRNQTWHLNLGLQASGTERNKFLLSIHLSVVFCYRTLAN